MVEIVIRSDVVTNGLVSKPKKKGCQHEGGVRRAHVDIESNKVCTIIQPSIGVTELLPYCEHLEIDSDTLTCSIVQDTIGLQKGKRGQMV